MSDFDSIVLIAFGGPEKPEDISPFLEIVTAGRRIPPARIAEVAHHYELIGGRSPLNKLTFRQAEGLRHVLRRAGIGKPVRSARDAPYRTRWQPLLESRRLPGVIGRNQDYVVHFHSGGSLRGILRFSEVSRAVVELREKPRKTLIQKLVAPTGFEPVFQP
jgi:hypothetical protein